MGVQGDLMSNDRWGRRCMLQLQEDENWSKPTTTTWAAEFLLKEFLGSWIRSSAVHKAKKRRAKQVITCSFPCGKWLQKIGARASPSCELCRRENERWKPLGWHSAWEQGTRTGRSQGTNAHFSERDLATRVPALLNIKTNNKTISQIYFTVKYI
jgi:hypothetical protein